MKKKEWEQMLIEKGFRFVNISKKQHNKAFKARKWNFTNRYYHMIDDNGNCKMFETRNILTVLIALPLAPIAVLVVALKAVFEIFNDTFIEIKKCINVEVRNDDDCNNYLDLFKQCDYK